MRITIPTTGSRGDVEPYVALGIGLRARGHQVCVATHINFEATVRQHGLEFYPLGQDARALQSGAIGDRMVNAGGDGLAFLREFTRMRRPLLRTLMHNCWKACRGSDIILASSSEFLLALSVAEREKLPVIWTSLMPLSPTLSRESCLFRAWPRWLPGASVHNWLTHATTSWGTWWLLMSGFNRARREALDLPPVPFYGPIASYLAPRLSLDGYSAYVAPRPADWNDRHHVTGYWFLDPDPNWQPPKALTDFLAAGPAPICIGFGSMHDRDADNVTESIKKALDRSGQRGILISGWGGLKSDCASDRVFSIDAVPHSWVFPRCAAVVHHGGAGTTGAGLRAGVPNLVVPFMADQPFWGRRVHALGAGPKPIPHRRLAVENLAKGIQRMINDQAMRESAADLGNRIRSEDGIERAINLLETDIALGTKRRPLGLWGAVRTFLRDSFVRPKTTSSR
jgi:sterol 3beta-glucosyltransferase